MHTARIKSEQYVHVKCTTNARVIRFDCSERNRGIPGQRPSNSDAMLRLEVGQARKLAEHNPPQRIEIAASVAVD